jgi:hypothetical protein
MIVYNVTINIDDSVHDNWIEWMKTKHIPDVMATGQFIDYKILHLLSRQEDEIGKTYAIQYRCKSMIEYEKYQNEFAPKLQSDTQALFGGKFSAFRTLLEEIN